MREAFEVLANSWPLVVMAAGALLAILKAVNKATPHSSQVSSPWAKALLVAIDLLDLLKCTPAPTLGGEKGPKKVPPAAVLLPLAIPLLMGCGSWQKTVKVGLEGVHTAAAGLSQLVEPYYRSKCMARALECRAAQAKTCPALEACQQERSKLNSAIMAAHRTVIAGYAALALEDEKGAKAKLAKALEVLSDLRKVVKDLGLLDKEPVIKIKLPAQATASGMQV